MQEMWVQPVGQENPPKEGMAAHSSVLQWRILWTEEPGGISSCGRKEFDITVIEHIHTFLVNKWLNVDAWVDLVAII